MRLVLASQSKLRISSSILLKLSSSQVTKVTHRECSSFFLKKLETNTHRHSKLLSPSPNLLVKTSIDARTFASSQTFMAFWNKSTPATTVDSSKLDPTKPADEPTFNEALSPPDHINLSDYNNTGYIPEPPAIIDESIILNAIGEPSLESLGLASYYTPIGWAQNLIEFMHVSLGLPWFASIVLFAFCMRACLFPITVKSQQNASKMKKSAPLMNRMKEKLSDAKMSGDSMKVARASNDYTMFMKSQNISIGTMALPVLQIPVFISAFMGIKRMCSLPVESMSTGGMLWFENLTLADPTYILPTISVLSLLAIIVRGVDTGMDIKNMTPIMKVGIFGMSMISFPFLIFMPAGIMVYFVTTNFISLILSFIMAVDPVKRALNIPIMSEYEKNEIKMAGKKEKNFLSGFMESIQNQKIIGEVKERESLRQRQFDRAGTQVPQKTYKYPPKSTK